MGAVYQKELRQYFHGLTGYLFAGLMIAAAGLLVAVMNLSTGIAEFSESLPTLAQLLILAIPLLTANTVVGERTAGTDLLLAALPLRQRDVILGKYFAAVTVFAVPVAVCAVFPPVLTLFGTVSLPAAYTALLGFFLLGCALTALCLFLSALTSCAVTGAALSAVSLLLIDVFPIAAGLLPADAGISFALSIILGLSLALLLWKYSDSPAVGILAAAVTVLPTVICFAAVPDRFRALIPDLLRDAALFSRLSGFFGGRLDLPGILFYLSTVCLFVFLTVCVTERRGRND